MSESDDPNLPRGPVGQAKSDVMEAAAWLVANRARYTETALVEELRASGYTEEEIAAIRAEAARRAPPTLPEEPPRRDLRAVAAIIVIVAFFGVWAYLSIPWLFPAPDQSYGFGEIGAAILGTILALIAIPTLFFIFDSDRLRRGTAGVLVAFLAFPFILLFVVAGMCVATTGTPQY